MAKLRDHQPIVLDAFMGLFDRGDKDNTPLDHFQDCINLRPVGGNSFATRYGIGLSQNVSVPLTNIKRIYSFPIPSASTIIVLAYDYNTDEGSIYHVINSTTVYGPVLTVPGMKDFAFLPYDGRGYISPFASQFPCIAPPSAAPAVALASGAGVDPGVHSYAVTFITAAGETTASPLIQATTFLKIDPSTPGPAINGNIPFGANPNVLTAGATYHWALTYSYDGVHETDLGATTVGLVIVSGATIGINFNSNIVPANARYYKVYRTLANGSTYFEETTGFNSIANLTDLYPSEYLIVGLVTDGVLFGRPNPPVSNGTITEVVDLTNIPVGTTGLGVTDRKIYRTAAGASQLKLLTTLADNTTTIYTDNNADSTLGADIPTKNTAVIPDSKAQSVGLQGEFLYVYDGLGHAARKAAGEGITGSMIVTNGAAGHTDPGIHIFGIVSETDTGYLSPPSILTEFITSANNSVSIGSIPTSGDPHVVKRHLVASIVIPSAAFTGNLSGYDMFFVPNATIPNNTDTFINNVSFYDADLLDDATYLFDNYEDIPAGAVLTLYHNRLVLAATFTDISLALVSAAGEPEAISQVDGLLIFPLDSNAISNAQELRDVLYMNKITRTGSYSDNGDVPSSWPFVFVDEALGTPVHGIATVLDSGSSSVDYLLICTYQGVSLFNGRFVTPELSWKIESYWRTLDRTLFDSIQIVNNPIDKEFYVILPDGILLTGNYANGLDPKNIRWWPNSFAMKVNTIAITRIDEVILGSDLAT